MGIGRFAAPYKTATLYGKYKFAQYENGEFELTDRINDPEENVNLVHNGQNPELLAEYRNKLLMMVLKTGSRFPEQFCHA